MSNSPNEYGESVNMIKIKCDYIGGAVAVPTDLIDRHLKLAPAAAFKVLLFILRNPGGAADAEQIAKCTGLSRTDVEDCLNFWQTDGVMEITDETADENAVKATFSNAKFQTPPSTAMQNTSEKNSFSVKSLPVKKPTQRDIAQRLSEESELGLIYTEAQNILGTFGYDTQALILMIYDYYGFPPEVIITLIQHQKCEGRTSSSAIKSRAEDWAKRGIVSLESVERELLALEKITEVYGEIKDICSFVSDSPTSRVSKYIRLWAVDWDCSVDLIKFALTESGGVIGDANKSLKKWVQSGVKTPADAEERIKKALPKEIKKSYDTEKIGKSGVMDWIKKYADEAQQ